MRIFNKEKTVELHDPDLSLGYLEPDRLFVAHHEAVEYVPAKGHYEVVKEYPSGGRDVKFVEETPAVEAKDAYDEYEDIEIYIPFTTEELLTIKRNDRAILLSAFDKWEKAVLRGREQDDYVIMRWYQSLLNLEEQAFENVPERIKYYFEKFQ